jgi:hypothetical protein
VQFALANCNAALFKTLCLQHGVSVSLPDNNVKSFCEKNIKSRKKTSKNPEIPEKPRKFPCGTAARLLFPMRRFGKGLSFPNKYDISVGMMFMRLHDVSLIPGALKILSFPSLRKLAGRTVGTVWSKFFWRQYKAALRPGRIPVTPVDHPLDAKIPFNPDRVGTYLDFSGFWVRTAAFMLYRFGRQALPLVEDFIRSIIGIYDWAAGIYAENLSTTSRPRYYGKLRFVIIHLTDPHLMCIPSLHVMLVIGTYTLFRRMLCALGQELTGDIAGDLSKARFHALDITASVLEVKQHSVNCIPAAMYAMSRFDGTLFPREEALEFARDIVLAGLAPGDETEIRAFIVRRYEDFLADPRGSTDWRMPLLAFLREDGAARRP